MIILQMYVQRLLKNKLALLFMLVIPVALLSFTMATIGNHQTTVGVADQDQTAFSQMIIDTLGRHVSVVLLTEEQLQPGLVRNRIDYGLLIPANYTEAVINQGEARLEGTSIQETNIAMPARLYLEGFLNAAITIAQLHPGDEQQFYAALDRYQEGRFALTSQSLDVGSNADQTVQGIGYLVLSMLGLATLAGVKILEDKEKHRFQRVLAAPITLKSYMAQTISGFFIVSILQVIGILVIMDRVLALSFGPSFFAVLVVLALFSVVCVAYGVGLSGLAKDTRQLGILSSLTITPMCMLGGAFWPRWIMPQFLQEASKFVPTTWAIQGSTKLILGASLVDIGGELAVLALFAVIFFLFGSWKKAEYVR